MANSPRLVSKPILKVCVLSNTRLDFAKDDIDLDMMMHVFTADTAARLSSHFQNFPCLHIFERRNHTSFLTLWTLKYIKLVIDYWQSGFYSCLREDYKMY